ncbi:ABC transporter substrate-binding protein [Gymnodinialimonas sp. 2305UL16-5]|uniref:ABC transporter substrate-binding protein n=1 Tax=Gymnodinialimonas mytili TaxID=3126503 RepID=UPI0030A69CB0
MKKFHLDRRQVVSLLGASVVSTAFASPVKANTNLVIGALRLTSHSPTYIALERGYFADEGLNIDLSFFESSAAAAVAVAGGDLDYGITSISGGLMNLAQRGVVKVIGGALAEDPTVPGQVILASNSAFEAGLTDPSQLAGRTFGTTSAGSSFHYMLSRIADANGIPMAEITMRPLQKVGAIIGALTSNQIDAWVIQPSIANRMIAEGSAQRIGDFSSYDPSYQVTAVFTSTEIATNERGQTETFLRALARGVADYNAAFVDKTADTSEVEELIELVHQYVNVDTPRETFALSLTEGSMRINQGLTLSTTSVGDQLRWMQSEGLVDAEITLDMLVDPSYVPTM